MYNIIIISMPKSFSTLDQRINVFETQYVIPSCIFSTFGNDNSEHDIRVAGTKITIPSTGNKKLVWSLNQYGCHCGYGSGTDSVDAYMFVRNETTSTVVITTTQISGGRGTPTLTSSAIVMTGTAGNTYQLYLHVLVNSDDHVVAFFNGGLLYVLPPGSSLPTSGYLLTT